MEISKGSLVYVIQGRGKGELFLVLNHGGKYVYLADGNKIKVQKPKKKNLKHINKTNTIIELDFENISDSTVRKALQNKKQNA